MQIDSVDATYVTAERRFGFGESTSGLLRLRADDGTVGIGEIPDIEEPDAAPDAADLARDVEAALVGEDPRRLNALVTSLENRFDLGGVSFHSFQQLAHGAVDNALYDLVGNRLGVPAYQLLGGHTDSFPISWVVYTRQSEDALDALEAEVEEKVAEGFSAFKLKVGDVDPAVDEGRIRTVREVAGDDATILLDAQGIWTAEEAIERVRRFEPLGIDGIETPAGRHDADAQPPGYYYDVPLFPADLAAVREAVDTPVIEHVLDPSFGVALAAADAVDVFTVEVCAGGIRLADQILALAESAGIDARLGSTVELGPGTAAAAALATASPAVTFPCDLIGPAMYQRDVLASPIEYAEGRLEAREEPGLGIDVAGVEWT